MLEALLIAAVVAKAVPVKPCTVTVQTLMITAYETPAIPIRICADGRTQEQKPDGSWVDWEKPAATGMYSRPFVPTGVMTNAAQEPEPPCIVVHETMVTTSPGIRERVCVDGRIQDQKPDGTWVDWYNPATPKPGQIDRN